MKCWQFWIDVGGTFTDCIAESPAGELHQWKTLSSGSVKGNIESIPTSNSLFNTLLQDVPENFWVGWELSVGGQCSSPSTTGPFTVIASSPDGTLTLNSPLPTNLQDQFNTNSTGSNSTGSITKSSEAHPANHTSHKDRAKQPESGIPFELHCPESAPLICIRRILGLCLDDPIPTVDLRMGTTRGTNALLERKGADTAFLVTKGFADTLLIGNQDRPELFALNIVKPAPLPRVVMEIEERLSADGQVIHPLNEEQVRSQLIRLRQQGIQSIAICLLHAYRNPHPEERVEALAREMGFEEVSRSSRVAPVIKLVPRSETTVLDAYLTPILRTWIDEIRKRLGEGSQLKLMGSQGGLIDGKEFTGQDSILSGPAGGIIGFSAVARQAGFSKSIGFDMGGTSTDVSRYGGQFELENESVKAGIRIASAVLSIETVAAGGGSICQFDGIQLRVGPESAGASPGPACYGAGGPLTVTDMNLALGRLLPDRFPFPLDSSAVSSQLDEMCSDISKSEFPQSYSPMELAQGFLEIANETMARAIRRISVRKGYDPAEHVLVCFGGAGGQHACALARTLNIEAVLIHPFAGLLSAYGMGLADVRRRSERTMMKEYSDHSLQELDSLFNEIEQQLQDEVRQEGIPLDQITTPVRSLNLRYRGVEAALLISRPEDGDYQREFERQHQQLYGYLHPHRPLEILSMAVEVVGRLGHASLPSLPPAEAPLKPHLVTQTWFQNQSLSTNVYLREQLRSGHTMTGPAIICDVGSTIWIEPDFQAEVRASGELLLTLHSKTPLPSVNPSADASPDPVLLEIFNNRFASIAEQMGVTLRKTSISTNVKERLDYSCALFDAEGGLVVNAPHIPVHLGAMGETVRCLLRDHPVMLPGDVFLTNDPYAGGSHLPDLTVVTPVHHPDTEELLFFTASRAHHAEIGGMTPGSMPPFSTSLSEEGVLISHFKLVDQGQSRLEELRELLSSGPFPSRNPQDNLADVSAQMAANHCGAQLLKELIQEFSQARVQTYMNLIQAAAEIKMRRALVNLSDGCYARTDFLDDGSPIVVRITVDEDSATIDFEGTGPVLTSNLNANRAIVTAAVLYVFRCLIDEPIPLNSGVLRPLEIRLPECLLNPPLLPDRDSCAAVVGGNVETSQRVVDVLLGALELAAASQGTMNNLTFGNEKFGYYETICGGAGATKTASGADAVQTHMTNTRMTDPEVFESRYPVLIREFEVRRGSGGAGEHHGGNGVRRVFEFQEPLELSLLTQRRGPYPPFGLKGGEPGTLGLNQLQRAGSTEVINLPASAHVQIEPGDHLTIQTPGGGGYGKQ